MKKIKALLHAITPTRDFVHIVAGVMLFIVVFSGLVLGLVLGINYVLVYTIGVHATEWVLTAIMIGFWGWLILRPLVDIVVRRYKEFLNERDD